MSIRIVTAAAVLLLVAACGGERDDESAPEGASRVDRAVAVASAITAQPAKADSILAAHGFTRESFDALLYEIAADSALAAEYARRLE